MKKTENKKNGLLRILTLGMMLIILLFGSLCLSACSSKSSEADEEEEMEEFKKDLEKKKEKKDKKKKEEAKEDKDETDAETESSDEPEPAKEADPADAKRALTEYAKGLDYIKGMTAEYTTVRSGDYDFKTDASGAPRGYFDYLIADFDGDGQDELLLPELVDEEKITLSMYEYKDGVELSDTIDYVDGVFQGDYNNTFCFIYDYDDLIYIGLFGDGAVYNTADGAFLGFYGYKYVDDSFVLEGSGGYAGSDGEEDTDFTKNLRKCGIFVDWDEIFADNAEWSVLRATDGYRLFSLVVRTGDVEYKTDEYIPFYLERYATYNGISVYEELYARESYIFPDSSYRILTEADLAGLSNEELRRGRNEIVARHGRRFDDEELQAYFDSKAWYRGTIAPGDFNAADMLNKTERDNMDFIKKHEK